MTNHCFDHSCSDYCWHAEKIDMLYDSKKHSDLSSVDETHRYFKDGKERISFVVYKCRMLFGYKLKYPDCGNYTGGAERVDQPFVLWDKNGQPKFRAQRNHPRIVQEPVGMFHWGANADLQIMLINSKSYEMAKLKDNDYGETMARLMTVGVGGLEEFTGADIAESYACGYLTKEWKPIKFYSDMFSAVAKETLEKNPQATQKDVFNRYAYLLCKMRPVPREESSYFGAGGEVSFNTTNVRSCSLSSVDLKAVSDSQKSSFTMFRLRKEYGARDKNMEDLTLYQFTAMNKQCVPNFFGYNDVATWPLQEKFARSMLFLHWPHRVDDFEDLKVENSWAKGLEIRMHHDPFPKQILSTIIRRRHRFLLEKDANDLGTTAALATEKEEREQTSSYLEQAALLSAAIAEAAGLNDEDDIERNADFLDEDFNDLYDGGPGYDWKQDYVPEGETWLEHHRDDFYEALCSSMRCHGGSMIHDIRSSADLMEEDIYRPENAKNFKQKISIGLCLLALFEWHDFLEMTSEQRSKVDPPVSYREYIQGDPGAGKTFVCKTKRNIVQNFFKSTSSD